MTAKFVYNQSFIDDYTCYCVNSLPDVGEPATNADMSILIGYYNMQDSGVYGYIDEMLSAGVGVPVGWYDIGTLVAVANETYSGVITDIEDDPRDSALRLLLSYDFYIYKNEWMKVPFAYEKLPKFDIKWDGVIGDRFSMDLTPFGFEGITLVKVSDEVFTEQQLMGAVIFTSTSYKEFIDESGIDKDTFPGALNIAGGIATIVYSADELCAAMGVPSGTVANGTYFYSEETDEGVTYATRLISPVRITPIDLKYLPLKSLDEYNTNLHCIAFTGNWYDLENKPSIYTDVIRYDAIQSLSSTQKSRVRSNIDVYSRSEVDNKIANSISNINLSGYAKTSDLSGYAKTSDLSGYAKTSDLSGYAKTSDLTTLIEEAINGAIGGSY
jgi:hypothetical protein